MAEAVLERRPKKKSEKKKEKRKQHAPPVVDDTAAGSVPEVKQSIPEDSSQHPAQFKDDTGIPGSIIQQVSCSENKECSTDKGGYQNPGLAEEHKPPDLGKAENKGEDLKMELKNEPKVSDEIPEVQTSGEEFKTETASSGLLLTVTSSSVSEVEERVEELVIDVVSHSVGLEGQSVSSDDAVHFDAALGVLESESVSNEETIPVLPVNLFEDLRAQLETVDHDYEVTITGNDTETTNQSMPVSTEPVGTCSMLLGESQVHVTEAPASTVDVPVTGVIQNDIAETSIGDTVHLVETPESRSAVSESETVIQPEPSEVLEVNMQADIQTSVAESDFRALETNTVNAKSRESNAPGILSEKEDLAPVVGNDSTEMLDHSNAISISGRPVPKPRVQHRKIYREQNYTMELVTSSPYRPLTIQQLQSLYYNPQLMQNEAFVQDFIQKEMTKETHEFYEILMDYFRARMNFLNAEGDIRALQKNYHGLLESLWHTKEKRVSIQGYCGDNVKCTANHTYKQCNLNEEVLENISHALQAIRTQLHEQFSLHAYSAQLSRFQVESYIHNLFMSCPVLRDIPRNAPVQATPQEVQNQGSLPQINRLKECISILFMFHRRPIKDEHFIQDTRAWTERLTAALLRVASFNDHLFILNHILRCPSGVGKWAGKLIQIVPPHSSLQQTSFGGPVLDHAITVLATILLPIQSRTEFICQMNVSASSSSEDKENMWILVDSDGEEDEDPSHSWQYLHENDIVALLKQFPSAAMFRHIFLMDPEKDNLSAYDVMLTGESVMIKVFAFATSFISLMSSGLQTFSMSRYRQLNKRLGRMIRQTVHYVSCHWQNFKTLHHELSGQTINRLQLEFDQFFLRATHAILTAEKLGSWQFMADMPFIGVSMETMWRLLWILHQHNAETLDLDVIPVMTTCIQYIKDPDNLAQFADNLVQLPTSESIYLLTTFSNMAQSRCEEEKQFVEVIVLEVFEIAYISGHTRDFCSKVGRELLSAMAAAHPFIISILVQRLNEVMEEIGMMCLYLFREMPLYQWNPSKEDVEVLGRWLLDSELHQPQNHLARLILSNLNWGFTKQEDRLCLPVNLHRQVALLLVQAYAKFVGDRNAGYAVLQGMKQVASAVRNQMTNEQQFNIWVWDLALRLHLHKMSLPTPVLLLDTQGAEEREAIPDVENDVTMVPVQKNLKSGNSMACFVALAMTKYGHSVADFTSTGLDVMMTLSSQCQHHAVIKLLSHIIPMFYQTPEYLLENDRFVRIVRQTLAADETYMKFAKSMIVNMFPGETIKLLSDMIQTQVNRGSSPAGVGGTVVVVFWATLLIQSPRWYQDRNSCYLLDNLIKSAFSLKGGLQTVKDLIKDKFKNHIKDQGGQGMVSSLVSWIASGTNLPSFIERSSSEFAWLAYVVLETEAEFEQTSKLWKTIQQELISDPNGPAEQALRKAATRLKLTSAPAVHRLNIYRWAQQALDTPIDHSLLPVFWQRFFVLYLGRLSAEAGMPQRASIGEKFFENSGNVTMMKKMKKRLSEASDYHFKIVPESSDARSRSSTDVMEDQDSDSDINEDRLEDLTYVPNRNFHQRLASLYRTFLLWMDEPRLHDASLYLPSLPPQYEASRLQRVFHNQTEPWMEYVDVDKAEYELSQMVSEWVKRSGVRACYTKSPHINLDRPSQTATEQILQRLTGHDLPDPPPPLAPLKPPVPDVSVQVLEDKQAILYILNADINILKDFSKLFMSRMSKHMALDVNYLELLPEEFYNQRRQVTLTAECKKTFNPTHKCKRAAVAQAEIEEKTRNEMVQRRIDENRAEFKQVMIEALLPPPPNICMAAVHVENVIVMLVKLCQTSTDHQRVTNLHHIASTLFYHVASMIDDVTNYYPPTRQFFSSCIEVLGQEFIRYNNDQVYTLLEFALGNPTLAGLLSPHFVPNHSPQYFINMYDQVSKVPFDQQHEMAFTFLSKFEVGSWLEGSKPSHGEVTQFLKVLSSAICRCGSKPNTKHAMMLELYCTHLKAVLQYRFPEYLEEILTHLLEGSSTESVNPRCWEAFCEICIGTKSRSGSGQNISHLGDQPQSDLTDHKSLLSITQIQRLLEWLGNYFTRLRTSNQDLATFGLYPKWGLYSCYVGELIRDLVQDLTVKLMVTVVDWTTQKAMEFIWQHMLEAFSPWIQPFDNQPEILTPWVENDSSLAIEMVSMFREDVEFVHNHFKGALQPYNCDTLSLLWKYYSEKLSPKGTPDFVLTVYHSDFHKLPWEMMQPSADTVCMMSKLKDNSCDESFLFMSRVFPRINWVTTLGFHIASMPPAVTSSLESGLFSLLLQFYAEKELLDTQDESLSQVFLKAEGFNWGYLISNSYCDATNWLLQNCDPACILSERSSNAALGPRLMKHASGFTVESSASWQPDMSVKRVNYIHCLVQLLCQCTFLSQLNTENFSTIIINLLTEIETVEGAVSDYVAQQEESLDMIKEMFSLLNNCNPDGNSTFMVMATFVQWLQSSPNSVLLMPCLKACSRSLASLNHMAQISEACIETYFSSVFDSSDISGWGVVLASLQIPELSLDDYFHEALQCGAYLTLFSYILQQLPLCQGLQDEEKLVVRFSDWLKLAKPSSENEAKIILWFYKFLTLVLRQVDFGTSPIRCAEMIQSVIPSLVHLGEDRSSTGLLGAIGLGRKSTLSHKIRVFARSLAAFLSSVIPGDGTLRIHPGPVSISSQLSRQTLGHLQAIKSSKEYGIYREHVEFAHSFILNESNTVRNSVALVVHLAHSLYPGQGYLMGVQHL